MSEDKKLYSLKTLLVSFIGGFTVVLILESIALWFLKKETRQQMDTLNDGLTSVLVAEQMQHSILNYDRTGVLYSITGDEQYLRLQEEAGKRINTLLEVADHIEEPEAQIVVAQTKLKAEDYFDSRRESQLQDLSPKEFVERNKPYLSELLASAGKLTNMDLDQAQRALAEARRLFNLSTTVNFAILAIFMVSISFFFLFTSMYFFTPMRLFTNYLERFATEKKALALPRQKSQEAQAIAQSLISQADYIANEEKRKLGYIAGVAHDLRSPLSAVLGNFELVELSLQQDKNEIKAQEAIARGKDQIEKISSLIDEFLDASKLQAGELKLNIENCELSSLLRKTIDQWKEIKPNRTFHTEAQSINIKCDLSRMERVFHNLLSNAEKYSEKDTPINITLKKEDPLWAHLVVEDFGSGIPKNELEEIFLPFKRSIFAEDIASGTGLGLNNIKMIVEAHGGKVWAESEVGRGSRFHACIPIA